MKDNKIYLFLKSNLFFFLLLTAVVFCLYGKSINFDFTYHDDDLLIKNQVPFLSDIGNAPKLFIMSCYFDRDNIYYRPILNLSFLIETCIFGLNTKIYHLTNIILFILALYLMYIFLVKLNLNQTILKFIVLLLSVHPIFTSTVVWIPARNDTLLAILIFLSFIFFINYLKDNSNVNLISYILFWTISLFTKETALLMVLLFPLFAHCFNYKIIKREIIKNLLIIIPIILIYFYLRNISTNKLQLENYLINCYQYFENMVLGLIVYIDRFVNPLNTNMLLYKIQLNLREIFNAVFVCSVLIYIYCKRIIDRKELAFFVIWFIACLFTTFLLPDYVYLNHRIIISIFSVIAVICYLADRLLTSFTNLKKYLVVLWCIFFIGFSYISFFQQDKYKEKNIYWKKAFAEAPTYHAFAYMLSRRYLEENNLQKAKELLLEAMSLSDDRYLSDLALIYYYEGDMDKSEETYNKAIEYGINKAQCYRNLSTIYLKRDKDINKSIEYAKLAVQESPYDTEYKQYLQNLTAFYNKLADEKNNI